MKKLIIICCLIVSYIDVFAQYSKEFYDLKRSIIAKISESVDSLNLSKLSSAQILLEFSDFKKFNYNISDGRGIMGFLCFREDTCNNVKDSICIESKSNFLKTEHLSFDKTYFKSFITSTAWRECNNTISKVLYSKLIEEPVGGWGLLEQYYFKRKYFFNKSLLSKEDLKVLIPVYLFEGKTILSVYIFEIEFDDLKIKIFKVHQNYYIE